MTTTVSRVDCHWVPLGWQQGEPFRHLFRGFTPRAMRRLNELYAEVGSIPLGLSSHWEPPRGKFFFLAFDQDELPVASVDCLPVDLEEDGEIGGLLRSLVVLPRHRRQGIGSALLRSVREQMQNPSVTQVSLGPPLDYLRAVIAPELTSAQRFFEVNGFVHTVSEGGNLVYEFAF